MSPLGADIFPSVIPVCPALNVKPALVSEAARVAIEKRCVSTYF